MIPTNPEPREHQAGEPLHLLVGPTASGKTALALEVAACAGAEIVSMDSMLVYRGMDVGTAKPDADVRARVPHHVVDVAEPPERYDVQRYLADARAALDAIRGHGARALVVGGTGFYLKALTHGLFRGPPVDLELRAELERRGEELGGEALFAELAERDPTAAARIHPRDRKRVVRALEVLHQTGRPISAWQREWGWGAGEPAPAPFRAVGLAPTRALLHERIAERTERMLAAGWVEEACAIRDGVGFGPTSIQALGYREVLEYADGRLTLDELRELVTLRTRQFARRQGTWFRKFPDIDWIDAPTQADALERSLATLGWLS